MDCTLGRITGHLAEPGEKLSPNLIDLLNSNINPPEEIGENDVHIRAMYIVSDEVNSYGGRFPTEEHRRLAELLVDSPVMIGHRKDKLPVGRTFHATLVKRNGRHWIKSYFYWLRSAEGAVNLRDNIDGGVYKECSIGFTFALPECSVCGEDIRLCTHEPFETYEVDGEEVSCHFNYRKIETVLETSLVYRGAIPDTAVSKELRNKGEVVGIAEIKGIGPLKELDNIESLDAASEYLVIPRYESLPVSVKRIGDRLCLVQADGDIIDEAVAGKFSVALFPQDKPFPGRLVGYRGKERCSAERLQSYLADRSGPVSRLVLMLLPHKEFVELSDSSKGPADVRVIPHRFVSAQELPVGANQIKTKHGVEIWPLDGTVIGESGYGFLPPESSIVKTKKYQLTVDADSSRAVLLFDDNGAVHRVEIINLNRELLMSGRRFVAGMVAEEKPNTIKARTEAITGEVKQVERAQEGLTVELSGELDGRYAIRPINLDGNCRWLFYRQTVERGEC